MQTHSPQGDHPDDDWHYTSEPPPKKCLCGEPIGEIARMRAAGLELDRVIRSLSDDVERLQQERDDWRNQFEAMRTWRDVAMDDRDAAIDRANRLAAALEDKR